MRDSDDVQNAIKIGNTARCDKATGREECAIHTCEYWQQKLQLGGTYPTAIFWAWAS